MRCRALALQPERTSSSSQQLEQLGMRRRRAGISEIVRRGGQPGAEMMLPDSVGQHSSQERRRPRAGLGKPARKGQPPAGRR